MCVTWEEWFGVCEEACCRILIVLEFSESFAGQTRVAVFLIEAISSGYDAMKIAHDNRCCFISPGQSSVMMRAMGDSHRRFLQTMMANGIVDEQGARTLYQHCCETHGGE